MVKRIDKGTEKLYVCEECGMAYRERKWAEKCERWCREHQSCNLEFTRYAVPLPNNAPGTGDRRPMTER